MVVISRLASSPRLLGRHILFFFGACKTTLLSLGIDKGVLPFASSPNWYYEEAIHQEDSEIQERDPGGIGNAGPKGAVL
jgi:hypothetical protein